MLQRFIPKTLFLLLFTLPMVAQAQLNKEIDSLKSLLKNSRPDTFQVNTLNKIAYRYSTSDSTNTFYYANQAAEKAKLLKFKPGIAGSLDVKGNYFLYKTNPLKALPFFQESLNLWTELKDDNQQGLTYRNIGQAYLLMQQYSNAIAALEKAEKIFLKTKNQKGLSATYHALGLMYNEKGDKDIAIDYMVKSLKIQDATQDKDIAGTLNNLGKLHMDIKNYPEAIKYYNLCIDNATKNNDYRNIGISQINLTNVYVNLLDYPKALEYLEKAKLNFEKSNFKRGVVTCYNNLGAINIRLERYEEAIPHLKKALEISQENQSKQGVALVQQNIGYAYTLLKKYPEALNWMVDAEKTAIQFGADQYTFGEIYNHRAMLDSAMGNYQGAFNYRSKYVAINDKTLNERVTRQVAETQTKYEVEKKELKISLLNKSDSIKTLQISNQQLALLDADLQIAHDSLELRTKNEIILQNRLDSTQKEEKIKALDNEKRIQLLELNNKELALNRRNQTIIGISILAVLLLLSGFLYYRQRVARQEQQSQKALAEQQEKATIAIIEAEEKERKRIASDLHDGVGQLMTAAWMNLQALDEEMKEAQPPTYPMFNKTLELVKESCNEVRQVSHNMMPNALLRKGLVNAVKEFISQLNTGKLSIHLATEELKNPLPSHVETILYRVIQESVNNVVKHAQASVLDISINQDSTGIDVMIEDNGKGFDPNITRPTDGIGLQNISSRIQYLKGTVEWDSAPGRGTLVAIHIPFTV